MSYEEFENKVFESHSAFNHYQSIQGNRVSNGATKPSIYITEIKIKNVLRDLTDVELEDILEKEMTPYNCKIQREKLKEKISNLHEWQLLYALQILLAKSRYEVIAYVKDCKRTDKEIKI